MTRYTSLGRKRMYLEAGFSDDKPVQTDADLLDENVAADVIDRSEANSSPPPAKRPKKAKQKRLEANKPCETPGKPQYEGDDVAIDTEKKEEDNGRAQVKAAYSSRSRDERRKEEALKSERSEIRRLKRKEEKLATATCFACREKGHAARDCPKVKSGNASDLSKGKVITGICYRCGSSKHTLSRCKKPENPDDPLPYASCYVCSKKGHLASSCPQNKEKGVYPNGGCCKLCGEKSHLAKNCPTRKQANEPGTLLVGTDKNVGADEDDFHLIKRVNAEVDQEERKTKKKIKSRLKAEDANTNADKFPKRGTGPARTDTTVTSAIAGKKKVVVF